MLRLQCCCLFRFQTLNTDFVLLCFVSPGQLAKAIFAIKSSHVLVSSNFDKDVFSEQGMIVVLFRFLQTFIGTIVVGFCKSC